MPKISFSIALPITLAGLFVLVMVLALNSQVPGPIMYAIFSLMAACVFLFGVAIGQSFALSITKLLKQAEGIAKGNVEGRLYLETKNELGGLATALNAIAQELETKKKEIRILENSVDMKVKARTDALRETITALDQKVKNRTLELEKITGDFTALQAKLKAKEAEITDLKNQLDLSKESPRGRKKKVEQQEPVQEV